MAARSSKDALSVNKSAGNAFRRFLTHRFLPLALVIIGVALTLPFLWGGLHLDDYILWTLVSGTPALRDLFPAQLNLFSLTDGDPQRTRQLVNRGILPWWTFEGIRFAFWRPLTSLTHWLDFTFWPDQPILMHLHNLIWFLLLLVAVTVMYRRLMGRTWAAGMAALFYAMDGTNAQGVAWVASRNVLLATLFGVLCLWAHDRWRRFGWRAGYYWAPVLLVLGLLSAEAAVATGAYLAAHAAFLDRDTWRRRLLALVPYGVIFAGWQWVYQRLGYGTFALSPLYVSPLCQPCLPTA